MRALWTCVVLIPALSATIPSRGDEAKSRSDSRPESGPDSRPESRPESGPEAKSGYRRLQPALFGLAIEQALGEDGKPRDEHRLVKVRGESLEVISTGTLDECEEQLLAALEKRYGTGNLNIAWKTLGGAQFWSDEVIYCGWRLQRNVYTGHCRLLDPADKRRAWGPYEPCRVALEKERIEKKLQPKNKRLVILVHGLFRTKNSFKKLAKELREAGFDVESISYPSTRRTIEEYAEQLGRVLESLPSYESVSFVTHSLGGIVVRQALATEGPWRERVEIGRLVMLAPPNQGSIVAELLEDWFLFDALTGETGKGLTPEAVAKIPEPSCEFGVIAGGNGKKRGKNSLLPGDNDGTVLVESTKLPSMKDFKVIDALHTFIMKDKSAIEATKRFLEEGRFDP